MYSISEMSDTATTSALKLIYLQNLCKVPHHAEGLERMNLWSVWPWDEFSLRLWPLLCLSALPLLLPLIRDGVNDRLQRGVLKDLFPLWKDCKFE